MSDLRFESSSSGIVGELGSVELEELYSPEADAVPRQRT
jgi:hypothetical protein